MFEVYNSVFSLFYFSRVQLSRIEELNFQTCEQIDIAEIHDLQKNLTLIGSLEKD
jgi:hypothetical protein